MIFNNKLLTRDDVAQYLLDCFILITIKTSQPRLNGLLFLLFSNIF